MNQTYCIDPGEIAEGDLGAYLHGDASPQVTEHVSRCAFCARQVEQLRMVDAQLLAAFYRDACPTPDVLADFIFNRLPATEKLRVATHVRTCAICSKEISAMRGLADETLPSLLARLRESLALALVARPVVTASAPARGKGWHGRFEIGDWVITLSARPDGLTGRVRRRDASSDIDYSGRAWLLSETMAVEAEIPHSVIDRRGRFQFTSLAGSYTVLLQVGDQNIAFEGVQV